MESTDMKEIIKDTIDDCIASLENMATSCDKIGLSHDANEIDQHMAQYLSKKIYSVLSDMGDIHNILLAYTGVLTPSDLLDEVTLSTRSSKKPKDPEYPYHTEARLFGEVIWEDSFRGFEDGGDIYDAMVDRFEEDGFPLAGLLYSEWKVKNNG